MTRFVRELKQFTLLQAKKFGSTMTRFVRGVELVI